MPECPASLASLPALSLASAVEAGGVCEVCTLLGAWLPQPRGHWAGPERPCLVQGRLEEAHVAFPLVLLPAREAGSPSFASFSDPELVPVTDGPPQLCGQDETSRGPQVG